MDRKVPQNHRDLIYFGYLFIPSELTAFAFCLQQCGTKLE